MRKIIIWATVLTVMLILNSTAFTAEKPSPFGLEVGTTTYEDCIKILKTRDWNYQEYEKKQFKWVKNLRIIIHTSSGKKIIYTLSCKNSVLIS